jgi:hypothetical protein
MERRGWRDLDIKELPDFGIAGVYRVFRRVYMKMLEKAGENF